MKVLLVLVAALVLAPSAQAYGVFPLFNQVASEVAGRPVEMRCGYQVDWRPDDPSWLGYVFWQNGTPQYGAVSPSVCWSLILLAADPENTVASSLSGENALAVQGQGQAVLVFAHEAVHLAGVSDEGQTECKAMGYIDLILSRFGVSEARKVELRLAAKYAHEAASPQYRTVC
jgi:hypothetical protein